MHFRTYNLEIDGKTYILEKAMVEVKRYQKTVHVEEIIPSVIEPSFGQYAYMLLCSCPIVNWKRFFPRCGQNNVRDIRAQFQSEGEQRTEDVLFPPRNRRPDKMQRTSAEFECRVLSVCQTTL